MKLVDSEIKLMMDDSYKRAVNILTTHRKELNLLAGKFRALSVSLL